MTDAELMAKICEVSAAAAAATAARAKLATEKMIDLTKIETPIGLLDAETREALSAHGGPYETYTARGWIPVLGWSSLWHGHSVIVVRVASPAPTPDVWPWDAIDKRFKYAARDADGELSIFTLKPEIFRDEWLLFDDNYQGGEYHPVQCLNVTIGTCDWKDSLVVRPGYVESSISNPHCASTAVL